MLMSHKDDHEGWTIQTECREDKPDDWKPGDPLRFIAWGTATFQRDYIFPGTWTSKGQQSFTHTHFEDSNRAHKEIHAALVAKVDSLKQLP